MRLRGKMSSSFAGRLRGVTYSGLERMASRKAVARLMRSVLRAAGVKMAISPSVSSSGSVASHWTSSVEREGGKRMVTEGGAGTDALAVPADGWRVSRLSQRTQIVKPGERLTRRRSRFCRTPFTFVSPGTAVGGS